MKIRCDNGLCDRLRFIFSHFYKLKKQHLVVCWKINNKCNGHFLDLFKPIKNIEFTEDESNTDLFDWRPAFNLIKFKLNIYQDLESLSNIKEKVLNLKEKMGKYMSVHIRRTDKLVNKIQKTPLTSDDAFIKFICKKKYNVFLATDCQTTQNKFKEIFGERLFWFEEIKKSWNFKKEDCVTSEVISNDFRPTSLKSTAVDLFTCIESNAFMGTNLSGMSKFIEFNRKWRKKIFL